MSSKPFPTPAAAKRFGAGARVAVGLAGALLAAGCGKPPEPTLNLHRAVEVGDLNQIERHLVWGTDLNQPGGEGDMPLHVAARTGKVGIVRDLARHGARLDAQNAAGDTPMELALAYGKTQVADALLAAGARLDPQAALLELTSEGVADRDSFDFLLRRGADANRPGPDGRPPLHVAVAGAHLETVKRLISRGADVNRPDAAGRFPLELAESLDSGVRDRTDIVRALTQAGARLPLPGPQSGRSPVPKSPPEPDRAARPGAPSGSTAGFSQTPSEPEQT